MDDEGPALDRDELSRTYGRYESSEIRQRWSQENPGNRFLLSERLDAQASILGRLGLVGRPIDVLDIGCGGSTRLPAELVAERRIGIDLLFERLVGAVAASPLDAVACADGTRLPFPDASFDLVILSTVLSSIPAVEVRAQLCRDAVRVLRPAGSAVVYDMRLPNPSNSAIGPVSRRELAGYFSGLSAETRSITLVPQLARRLGDRAQLYRLLAGVPVLRSHRLSVFTKP